MSELDDLEEIDLRPARATSAKRVRAGRRYFIAGIERAAKRPKWKHQLASLKRTDRR